jgi:hypothetical protein
MIETKNHDNVNLFPRARRNRAGFTEEQMQDIVRFAQAYGIDGVARVQLLARLRDARAARAIQKRNRSKQSDLY